MFRALLALPREVCTSGTWYIACVLYRARNIPSAACLSPPEDKQVMFETCRGP
jgi:hypothetical protein